MVNTGDWGVYILFVVLAACFQGCDCLTFGCYNISDIYVGGLRPIGCDAYVACGSLGHLIFTWIETMFRNPGAMAHSQ